MTKESRRFLMAELNKWLMCYGTAHVGFLQKIFRMNFGAMLSIMKGFIKSAI